MRIIPGAHLRACRPGVHCLPLPARSVALRSGIRDFIARESPVRGLDGIYKERPRDATIEAVLLALDADETICPGAQRILRVPSSTLDQLIADKGEVLVAPVRGGSLGPQRSSPSSPSLPPAVVPSPRAGSYACLAHVVGCQRTSSAQDEAEGGTCFVRVVVEERASVQAISGTDRSQLRARAALLPDRWVNFVRADAVEALSEAVGTSAPASAMAGEPSGGAGPEVVAALDACRESSQEVATRLRNLAHLSRQLRGDLGSSAAQEWRDLLAWAFIPDAADFMEHPDGAHSGHTTFATMRRLSFAPFAAEDTSRKLLGCSVSDITASRRKALEASDMGLRLEDAAEYVRILEARLGVLLALQ